MNTYEMLMMFDATVEGESLDLSLKNVERIMENYGAEFLRTDKFGRKKLAYPIKKAKETYMAVIGFKMEPANIAPMSTDFNNSEDVMRYTIVRNDELDPEKAFTLTPVTARDAKDRQRGRRDTRRGGNVTRSDQFNSGERRPPRERSQETSEKAPAN